MELEKRKRKARFGTRAHSKIFEAAVIDSRKKFGNDIKGLGPLEKNLVME